MTAIVGMVHGGKVYLGGDSAGTWPDMMIMDRWDRKVFRRGPYLIGFTTSFRMGQLIRYHANLPEPWDWEQDLLAFMTTRFVDAIRACLSEHAWSETDKGRVSGGEFLVGFRGELYHVFSDFQVTVRSDGFDAAGAGTDLALGVMHVFDREFSGGYGPEARIETALEAAERFNAAVRRPFHIEVSE